MDDKTDFESGIEGIAYWLGAILRFSLTHAADILFIALLSSLRIYGGSIEEHLYFISFYLVHLSLKMEWKDE